MIWLSKFLVIITDNMLPFLLTTLLFPLTQQVYTPEFLAKVPSVDFSYADAKRTEILYYLFKNSSQTTAIVLNENDTLSEDEKKLPTKILMHGFGSNVTSPWYKEMKKEYFKKGHHNIIYIDWSVAGNKNFTISAANIKPVGEFIADFIINLQIPLENIHLIGHSLGSHLAGFIGKFLYSKTKKKVGRITATDAAGPGFEYTESESRLSKDDAIFVDVIHTDCGYFGIKKPIGHVDFYINGGKKQPGCPPKEIDDNCCHARSNIYFIESINCNVMAKEAKYEENGEVTILPKLTEILFGDSTPMEARGVYYLETNSHFPFLSKIPSIKSS